MAFNVANRKVHHWVSGMWMVWVPFVAKRRRSEKRRLSRVASAALLGSSLLSLS